MSWLYHQTTLREPYEYRHRRHPDVDEVVMINERGELTETTRGEPGLAARRPVVDPAAVIRLLTRR